MMRRPSGSGSVESGSQEPLVGGSRRQHQAHSSSKHGLSHSNPYTLPPVDSLTTSNARCVVERIGAIRWACIVCIFDLEIGSTGRAYCSQL